MTEAKWSLIPGISGESAALTSSNEEVGTSIDLDIADQGSQSMDDDSEASSDGFVASDEDDDAQYDALLDAPQEQLSLAGARDRLETLVSITLDTLVGFSEPQRLRFLLAMGSLVPAEWLRGIPPPLQALLEGKVSLQTLQATYRLPRHLSRLTPLTTSRTHCPHISLSALQTSLTSMEIPDSLSTGTIALESCESPSSIEGLQLYCALAQMFQTLGRRVLKSSS